MGHVCAGELPAACGLAVALLPAAPERHDSTLSNAMALIGERLEASGESRDNLEVRLSRELVSLLSEQLYTSPVKAIEELVVNAFDADATVCRARLPDVLTEEADDPIVVYDDGVGMDLPGLADLWHIGHSSKRTEEVAKRRKRQQIGKFGIGKLATYAIARHITYLSKTQNGPLLSAALDYEAFKPDPTGGADAVSLPVVELPLGAISADEALADSLRAAGVPVDDLSDTKQHFTIVVLEGFKPKVAELQRGRLRWVLATAMPLRAGFTLYLDDKEVPSSKETFDEIVRFAASDLPQSRLESLAEETGEQWTVDDGALRSPTFKLGVKGEVVVTERTLTDKKSSDLRRSHGFFVRVRDRLVNIEDPLFGLTPLSHQTFNRFRADLEADDLDAAITAPRESVESTSDIRAQFETLLEELFYEARARYEKAQRDADKEKGKREHERNYVAPGLIEYPVADAISTVVGDADTIDTAALEGADADEAWFYLDLKPGSSARELLAGLYGSQRETTYTYVRTQLGETGRLVRFDPAAATFVLNADHPLVRAHDDDGAARPLLEDVATAEALLEVYLREQHVPPAQIGEILERRDRLLRSLTRDRVYSLANIAADLRAAKDDEHDLEAALVTACRALGFVSKHIAGSSQPDGIARLTDNRAGEVTMTLEAKSSKDVPSLNAIDFASLARHRDAHDATACLLVAPSYPGSKKGENAAAAEMAATQGISCWTVAQLADVTEQAERRHISARDVYDLCTEAFPPDEVAKAVDRLLSSPDWDQRALYRAVLAALRSLEGRLPGTPRRVEHIHSEISRGSEFRETPEADVTRAISDLAGASQGALVLRSRQLVLNTSLDELEVRVKALVGEPGTPRRPSTFRRSS
jgi:hypothetical protein